MTRWRVALCDVRNKLELVLELDAASFEDALSVTMEMADRYSYFIARDPAYGAPEWRRRSCYELT